MREKLLFPSILVSAKLVFFCVRKPGTRHISGLMLGLLPFLLLVLHSEATLGFMQQGVRVGPDLVLLKCET